MYLYFIDIIFRPLQENGIRIVQLGLPNEPIINGCVDLRGRTSFKQLSYLVGNAEMHVGADSCCTHFASGENKKIVSLYSIMPDKNCGPYWSDRRDVCCINAKRKAKKKPSYNYLSDDNTINQISPEDISENIPNEELPHAGIPPGISPREIFYRWTPPGLTSAS